ncbi:MAG TPA: Npt1/Npt2 family nucleotide transporter [Polyangiaceae bacterium]|nr:Npt1/Npt2 family nucleotide transporter [Polyangiaceae bacterium]
MFTRVDSGEGFTALVLTLNIFVLMTAYSAIKPVREGLILSMRSGAEYKAYMGAGIATALLFAVPAYARVADRYPRNRLVAGVTLFFASNLVLFRIASAVPALRPQLGLVFFLWLGVFNLMVIAQFWAFANDLYREEQGKRLFPLIGVGQTLGAAAGSGIAVLLLEWLGVYQMLLVSAGLLVVSAGLTQLAHGHELKRRSVPPPGPPAEQSGADAPAVAPSGAFQMVWRSEYLRAIAVFSVLFTFVNSNGEYMLGRLMKEAATAAVARGAITPDAVKEYVGEAYSRFYLFTNIATVVLQAFLVSRFVRRFGIRFAFLALPIIPFIDAVGVGLAPVLGILFVGKVFENSLDYSLNNTLRNMLWLPTTREMKYKAKQAIDTFFVRMGDVTSALFVYLIAGVLGLGVRTLAMASLVACGLWFLVARTILKRRDDLSTSLPPPAPDAITTEAASAS